MHTDRISWNINSLLHPDQSWDITEEEQNTFAALWRGVTAMRAMMVEQLGFAMMPPCPYLMPFMASGFTSGMTRGTPSVILKAELLSTTCTPHTTSRVWERGVHMEEGPQEGKRRVED